MTAQMPLTVAILAPGAMGSAVASRLTGRGASVVTVLTGRSPQTIGRAHAAGMRAVDEAQIGDVDILLSIMPPDQALPLAERISPFLAVGARKPIYADCNAVSPQTVVRIAKVIERAGCPFADASIIGTPPRPGYDGPTFFASGENADRLRILSEYGLKVRVLDGPIGAASALKMCYGGITKGLIAVGSAMLLSSVRAGVDEALLEELGASQAHLLAGFSKSIPDMFSKAGRWVPEMDEIAAFLGRERAEGQMYEAMAGLYARLASDQLRGREEIDMLDRLARKHAAG